MNTRTSNPSRTGASNPSEPTTNLKLSDKQEREANELLSRAVGMQSRLQIRQALLIISEMCRQMKQGHYIMPYANWTQESELLMQQRKLLELTIWFGWTKNGPGTPLARGPRLTVRAQGHLPGDIHKQLCQTLGQALDIGGFREVGQAIKLVKEACEQYGVGVVQVPIQSDSEASGLLMACYSGKGFPFKWAFTEGGRTHGPVAKARR